MTRRGFTLGLGGTGPPVFVQAPQFQKVWQRAMLGLTKNCYVGYNVCTNNVVWQLWRIQGANLAMTVNWILGGCPSPTVNQSGNFQQVTKNFRRYAPNICLYRPMHPAILFLFFFTTYFNKFIYFVTSCIYSVST